MKILLSMQKITKEIKKLEKVCMDFLPKVSRTFAISISKLPKKQCRVVMVSYLFCRILDTIEDSFGVNIKIRIKILENFKKSFNDRKYLKEYLKFCKSLKGLKEHIKLCYYFPEILILFDCFDTHEKENIKKWVFKMADGMANFMEKYPKGLRIKNLAEYHQYCFVVAGTVGHLLTNYWNSLYHFNKKDYQELVNASENFSIALQSINILKDIQNDLYMENNVYLPKTYFDQYQMTVQKFISLKENNSNKMMINWFFYCYEKLNLSLEKYFFKLPIFLFSVKLFCIVPLLFAFATWQKTYDFYLKNGYILNDVKISRKSIRNLFILSHLCIFSKFFTKNVVKKILKNKFK